MSLVSKDVPPENRHDPDDQMPKFADDNDVICASLHLRWLWSCKRVFPHNGKHATIIDGTVARWR